jgi:HNH endonuclease
MSLTRRVEAKPGPARPRAVVATPRVAASPEQRRKVDGLLCLVCGRAPVDPAHLVPQRLGGCGAADCVVPLCRTHHRLFDSGRLVLVPYLGPELERELRHALTHVGCAQLEAALTGGWPAPWAEAHTQITTGGGP